MLKKVLALLMVLVLGVTIMVGCASNKESNQLAPENNAPSGAEKSDAAKSDGKDGKKEKYVIKLSYENNDGDPIDQGCDRWAELVKERTNGAVEIRIYPSSQLGAKKDLIEMMLMGQNVATIADGSYLMDYVPDIGIVMGPYVLENWDQMFKLTASDWWAEQAGLLEKEGIKIVTKNWIYGDRHLLTKKPVAKLTDLAGAKIRVPNNDISVKMFNLLGAASTPMALSEVYTALSQGVVDGVENPLTVLYDNKFQETCQYLTLTGHQKTFSTFVMGEKFFSSLPTEYQKIIMEAGDEAAKYNNEIYQKQTAEMLDKFKAAGVEVSELSDLEDFKAAVKGLYDSYESEGTWTKGLYDKVQSIIK
ncbi:C4-dicarboxylate TRAP transporter substrate-binding protein [Petroclostridium sp. X23]|uniref:C4-dicarboxylate TRAP transporter substrate-binding protein n=1 Tax=Petroclostridium sp. X23 TaxID=3045146 RepID=UPI0024ACBAD9|nr:C4-dicarboxylate TRAP transporter substrate-binding protein [Petroclostridium sp. X23]WHH57978.1 C4-dicarboxylate TRAP transporter substrate-binding protein [Petroclostridium sp. X23]